jgi:hypothetical protein
MKWGVHRADPGGASPAPKTRNSADHTQTSKTQERISSGGLSKVSNKDLQALVKRQNLEKQYRELNQEKNALDLGSEHVNKILKYGKTYNDVKKFLDSDAGKALKKGFRVAGVAAKVGAAYASGGTSAAAGAAGTIVVRRMANHYTNVGR